MITAVIREYLLQAPGVTAMVGDRVYIDELPRDPVFPAISIHPVYQAPDWRYNGGHADTIQVSLWDNPPPDREGRKSSLTLEKLRHEVITRMHHGAIGDWASLAKTVDGVVIQIHGMRITGGSRVHDPVRGWLHVPLTARIAFLTR